MLTKEQAQRIVETFLKARTQETARLMTELGVTPGEDDELVVREDATKEYPFLWVFRYMARAGLKDPGKGAIVGAGPIAVHRGTGELHEFGSGFGEDERLADLERRTRMG